MLAKLPNELLHYILCDVVGTYIHAFTTLPPSFHCWPAHSVLRSVSKHFKALVDDIWEAAIGSGEEGQRGLLNIRAALLSRGNYVFPTLSRLEYLCTGKEFENEAGYDTTVLSALAIFSLPVDQWLKLTMGRISCVRPREVAYILEYAVRRIKYSHLHDLLDVRIRSSIREAGGWIRSLQAIQLLEHSVSASLTLFTQGKPQHLDYMSIMTLEEIVRSYPPLAQEPDGHNQVQDSFAASRKNFSESVSLLKEAWNDWNSFNEVRKRALHEAASLWVQSPGFIAVKSRHEKPAFYFLYSKRILLTDSAKASRPSGKERH